MKPLTLTLIRILFGVLVGLSPSARADVNADITLYYRIYLGRLPSATDLASWRYTAAISGMAAVESGIRTSGEAVEASDRIQLQYRTLLGRKGTADDIKYWLSQTADRGRDFVLVSLAQSPEAFAARALIDTYYRRALARPPSLNDYPYWLNIAADQTFEGVRQAIAASAEAAAASAIIRDYYLTLLARFPSSEETAYHLSVASVFGYEVVRLALVASPAAQQVKATIDEYYRAFLGRPAGIGEVSYWAGFTSGNGWPATRANIDQSGEANAARNRVEGLYRQILARSGTDPEWRFWVSAAGHGTWDIVIAAIRNSDEGKAVRSTLEALFRQYFGRRTTNADADKWLGIVSVKGWAAARTEISQDPEARMALGKIREFYQTYLRRAASNDELFYWIDQAYQITLAGVETAIRNSPEAVAKRSPPPAPPAPPVPPVIAPVNPVVAGTGNCDLVCSSIAALNGNPQDAAPALQSCLDAAYGKRLCIPKGVYRIGRQIRIGNATDLSTENHGRVQNCGEAPNECAHFIASPSFVALPADQRDPSPYAKDAALFSVHSSGVSLRFVGINGAFPERITPYERLGQGDLPFAVPKLLMVHGHNFTLEGVSATGAIAYAGVQLMPKFNRGRFVNNLIGYNGNRASSIAFADGLNLFETQNTEVIGNLFVANTDVDLGVGGMVEGRISANRFVHSTADTQAHAAILLHAWLTGELITNGDYARTLVDGNTVDCRDSADPDNPQKRWCVGIEVGTRWYAEAVRSGWPTTVDYDENPPLNPNVPLVRGGPDPAAYLRIEGNLVAGASIGIAIQNAVGIALGKNALQHHNRLGERPPMFLAPSGFFCATSQRRIRAVCDQLNSRINSRGGATAVIIDPHTSFVVVDREFWEQLQAYGELSRYSLMGCINNDAGGC